jgi:hypothetical protein
VRTVSWLLAHLGLNRRRFLDPTGENNRQPRRIHARWPGHMVHLDVKKVGVIPDGGGWRVHGRGSEAAKQSVRGRQRGGRARYTYLHTAIDGFSRLAYTEALPDEQARTAISFTHRARAFFASHDIPSELLRVWLGHSNILPGRRTGKRDCPEFGSRCHLSVQQSHVVRVGY